MASWSIFAFLAVIFSVSYGLISKGQLNNEEDHNPIAYASALFLCVSIFTAAVYVISGSDLQADLAGFKSSEAVLLLAANFSLYSIAPSFYWRALKNLPVSEVSILYDLTALHILIFGVALGTESFNLSRLAGGLLIVSAAILLGIATSRKVQFKVNRHFWMLIIATFLYALAAITDNVILTKDYFSPLFLQILGFGIPSILILILNPKAVAHLAKIYRPQTYKFIVLNALFFFGSVWAMYQAYDVGGPTSGVSFIGATETILTVTLAGILLKENEHIKLKVLCAVIAGIGVYLIL